LPYNKTILFECDKVTDNSECDTRLDTSTKALDKYISSGYKGFYPIIVERCERSDKIIVIVIEPPEEELVRCPIGKKLYSVSSRE